MCARDDVIGDTPNVSSGGEPFPQSFREMFYAHVRASALCIRRRKHRGVYSPRAYSICQAARYLGRPQTHLH